MLTSTLASNSTSLSSSASNRWVQSSTLAIRNLIDQKDLILYSSNDEKEW